MTQMIPLFMSGFQLDKFLRGFQRVSLLRALARRNSSKQLGFGLLSPQAGELVFGATLQISSTLSLKLMVFCVNL